MELPDHECKDKKSNFKYVAAAGLCAGVAIAIYGLSRKNLFKRYTDACEIRKLLCRDRVYLKGVVRRVNDNSTLSVEHLPKIRLSCFCLGEKEYGLLPIAAAGIENSNEVKNWMKLHVLNTEIQFAPLATLDGNIQCDIIYKTPKNKLCSANDHLIRSCISKATARQIVTTKLEKPDTEDGEDRDPIYMVMDKAVIYESDVKQLPSYFRYLEYVADMANIQYQNRCE